LEKSVELGQDTWVVGNDSEGYEVAYAAPPIGLVVHHVRREDALEQMCLEPTAPPQPRSSGSRKVGKIRGGRR
jgi:hypothetical protein